MAPSLFQTMDNTKNIHEQIKDMLDQGVRLRSEALGRVGLIMSVSPDGKLVYIRRHGDKTTIMTTFLRGDRVGIVHSLDGYKVVNAGGFNR